MSLGLIIASFSTKVSHLAPGSRGHALRHIQVWHLYLTQGKSGCQLDGLVLNMTSRAGLIFGLGSGLAFIPAVTILSQWVSRHFAFTLRLDTHDQLSLKNVGAWQLVLA